MQSEFDRYNAWIRLTKSCVKKYKNNVGKWKVDKLVIDSAVTEDKHFNTLIIKNRTIFS